MFRETVSVFSCTHPLFMNSLHLVKKRGVNPVHFSEVNSISEDVSISLQKIVFSHSIHISVILCQKLLRCEHPLMPNIFLTLWVCRVYECEFMACYLPFQCCSIIQVWQPNTPRYASPPPPSSPGKLKLTKLIWVVQYLSSRFTVLIILGCHICFIIPNSPHPSTHLLVSLCQEPGTLCAYYSLSPNAEGGQNDAKHLKND